MLIYYYATFGPGHQSSDGEFMEFPDDTTDEWIEDYIYDECLRHYDNIVLRFWKVDELPISLIESQINNAEEDIEELREKIERLRKTECFIPNNFPGRGYDIQRALKGKVVSDVLKRLHQENLMFDEKYISDWRYGKMTLLEPQHSKVIEILEKSDSY